MILHQSNHNETRFWNRLFTGFLIFTAAYFTTITVRAQDVQATGDAIQLNSNDVAVITGSIIRAEDNYVIINSAGKDLKVVLDRVDLKGDAGDVFQKGMMVTVEGKMEGNDFGIPLVEAKSITATESDATTYYQNNVAP